MICQKTKLNPLVTKSDIELVELVKLAADSDAFVEVCRRYENIFYKVCQKYASTLLNKGINPQDIFEEKNYIIFHCVSTFDTKRKTKLGTWIGNYARYLCLNSINARRFIMPTTDEDLKKHIEESQVTQDYFEQNGFTQEEYNYLLKILEQLKDPRMIQIFKLRYLGSKRVIWADIASSVGVSTQTVINLHNKGLTLLKNRLKGKIVFDTV